MGRTQRKRRRNRKCIKRNDISRFLNLQKALRLKCQNIEINYFNETGWGIRCKKKIEKGDVLIALPLQYLITTEVSCEIFSVLEVKNQMPQFILSTFLIYESHLGNESKHSQYIESLPESFTNLYFCTSEEINVLPEFIKKEVTAQTIFIEGIIKNLFAIIRDKFCPHCDNNLKDIFTRKKLVWAWFIVNTRSVYYEDRKLNKSMALAPFLDLFNHSNDAVTSMYIDFEKRLYILKTNNNFKKFEQIFIKYGNHSNLQLFLEYGFILPDNPNDYVEFSFEEVLESVKRIDVNSGGMTKLKYKFIESNKLNKNLTKNEEFSWNFNSLVFVLITADDNLSVLQSKTYSNSFSINEKIMIQKISNIVAQRKYTELKQKLLQMEAVENCTPSFQIAKNLTRYYLNLLL